jgi:hypothetical protein
MGGVIIDGMTALQFKGPVKKFRDFIVSLDDLQDKVDWLKIDTVPLPDRPAMRLELKFKCKFSELEKFFSEFNEISKKFSINVFPDISSVSIGTWPTPENKKKNLSFFVNVSI